MRQNELVTGGDVFEFTLRGERRTAVAMLVSDDDDAMLIDLLDDDRPVWARPSALQDVTIFRPDYAELGFAAA